MILREKSPNTEFFLVRIFPHCGESYGVSLRIQFECGKIRTRRDSMFGLFSRYGSLVLDELSVDEEDG